MRDALPLNDFFPIADALQGRTIVDAYAIGDSESGEGEYQSVHLILEVGICRLEVDIDSDEIHAFVEIDRDESVLDTGATHVLNRDLLSPLVGKEIGWSWTCYNSQGYRDTIMMAVPGVVPTVVFHAVASRIRIGFMSL
jgi:hypothetical protein